MTSQSNSNNSNSNDQRSIARIVGDETIASLTAHDPSIAFDAAASIAIEFFSKVNTLDMPEMQGSLQDAAEKLANEYLATNALLRESYDAIRDYMSMFQTAARVSGLTPDDPAFERRYIRYTQTLEEMQRNQQRVQTRLGRLARAVAALHDILNDN